MASGLGARNFESSSSPPWRICEPRRGHRPLAFVKVAAAFTAARIADNEIRRLLSEGGLLLAFEIQFS